MQIFIIIALIIAILAVTFALQNPVVIVIKFLAWEFSGSLALVLLGTFALGFISSALMGAAGLLKRKLKQTKEANKDFPPPNQE